MNEINNFPNSNLINEKTPGYLKEKLFLAIIVAVSLAIVAILYLLANRPSTKQPSVELTSSYSSSLSLSNTQARKTIFGTITLTSPDVERVANQKWNVSLETNDNLQFVSVPDDNFYKTEKLILAKYEYTLVFQAPINDMGPLHTDVPRNTYFQNLLLSDSEISRVSQTDEEGKQVYVYTTNYLEGDQCAAGISPQSSAPKYCAAGGIRDTWLFIKCYASSEIATTFCDDIVRKVRVEHIIE